MDANGWLREYQQDVQNRLARAEQVKEQVNAATGAARSADGAVLVTVGPTGALQDLQLSPKADGMPSTQLAQLILRTAREAHRKVAEQLAQAVKPLIGDSEAMSFLESQIPPAEEPPAQDQTAQDEQQPFQQAPQWGPPPGQQPPPPQPPRPTRPSRPAWDDDDNDDNGPILR